MKATNNDTNLQLISISQQLLLASKTKAPTGSFIHLLKDSHETAFQKQLNTDENKKAFWINIYNAYTQIILSLHPDKYKKRSQFFRDKQIAIAGKTLSLDDIEHGILRRSKVKWGLGYINKLFPPVFEKENRVERVDYRIHFTLNCGAKSCPPVAFYDPQKLDHQLELATRAYLSGESEYNEERNIIYLPAIMRWFRGDFGGKRNMITILKQHGIIPQNKHPAIKFNKYNWNLYLSNYTNEGFDG